jgi:hypothetical protein
VTTQAAVRLQMSIAEAERLRDLLIAVRGSRQHALLHDALWLRTLLIEQRRQVPIAEWDAYTRRADALLRRLLAAAAGAESVRSRDYLETP